ncbi:MAG: HutP family protein [Bacillota bacterium]
MQVNQLGKIALKLTLADDEAEIAAITARAKGFGYLVCTGKVGSMDLQNIIGTIETMARKNKVVNEGVVEQHALYHAIYECCSGFMRGSLTLGGTLRTLGSRFAIVRGKIPGDVKREWLAVAMYGTIGSPSKGFEHEAAGLGIIHI